MRLRLSAFFAALSLTVVGVAEAHDPVLKFHIQGSPSVTGKFTNLHLTVAAGSPKAISFYSEPSHTLLGVFLDNSEGNAEDQSWFEDVMPVRVTQVIQMALQEGASATLQGPRPAANDQFIYVKSRFLSEGEMIDKVMKLATRTSDFNFGLQYDRPAEPVAGGREISGDNHLVGGPTVKIICGFADQGTCSYATAQCGTAEEGRCCWSTDPQTSCGWCGKKLADCKGSVPCEGC